MGYTPGSADDPVADLQAFNASVGSAIDAVRSGPVEDLLNRFVLDHPPAAFVTADLLTAGTDLYPSIVHAGDTNLFRVALDAETTYWFNAEGSSTGRGTISVPYMRLLDTNGVAELASGQGNGVGLNAFLSYTPATTGTYFMEAGASGGSTGSYTLTERVADDYPNNPATNGTLAAGGDVEGSYDFVADTDWFRTKLTAGTTYRFDAESTPTGPGTQIHPLVRLFGERGTTEVASDLSAGQLGGGYSASLSYTPTVSGTYYISIGSYGTNVGTYRLGEATTSGVTALSAADSRMSFIAGSDDASPAATAVLGTAVVTSQPEGNAATGALVDTSVGAASLDQLLSDANSAPQPQYAASDVTQHSAASLTMATSGQAMGDASIVPDVFR